MESIEQFIKRNENQSLQSIIDSLKAVGFSKLEIQDAINDYIDGKF